MNRGTGRICPACGFAKGRMDFVWDALPILGWEKIAQSLAGYAETEMGREDCLIIQPDSDAQALEQAHATLKECLAWLESGLGTASGAVPLLGLIERAGRDGILAASEFLALGRTLEVHRVLGNQADPERYPLISARFRSGVWPRTLADAIAHTFDPDGLVRDQASPVLSDLRRQIRHGEREIDQIFDRIVKSGEWSKYLQEGLVTVRYGRRVVPVKHEFRNSVAGIIHDQSGSGQTVFVEPLSVVERQNHLTTLRQDEAREIERILTELTRLVKNVEDTLKAIHHHLKWFDGYLARSRYGLSLKGCLPLLGGTRLDLKVARHPLLLHPVPLSLTLSATSLALIITGPNTGGKTVALKTAGVVVCMALSGLMVPAGEGSAIPLYHRIMADIGDEQSLEQNLSTFSSHVARLVPMMASAGPKTLCLIDEIGAGTDPDEGAALAEVMVDYLVDQGAHLIASTHYSRLKLMALSNPRIQNALMEFNRETLSPTYRLVMGSPGSSYAFNIARQLGLPADMVDRAQSIMDPAVLTLTDAIETINHFKQELDRREEQINAQATDLKKRLQDLEDKEAKWAAREERERARGVKAWQGELERMREKFEAALALVRTEEGRERARAVEQLRAQYRGLANLPENLAPRSAKGTAAPSVGDHVRVFGFDDVGTVTEIIGRTATVDMGAIRMKLALDELERVDEIQEKASLSPKRRRTGGDLGQEKSRTIGVELDLRGMTQDEALEVLDKYLDDAVLASAPFVRIIHGKGTGVLRRAVSQALRGDPRVFRYRLGDAGEGGDGVTVAHLEESD